MDDFNERVDAFVKHVEQVFINEHNARGYKFPHPTIKTEIRAKWIVLIRNYNQNNDGVYAFIAREDFNNNKTLGPVKKGDIHRPASFKAAAKHARGSIFTNDFGNCAGPYGISYLK
jgi:hypothetical protein